jgi:eukaryotic-like serine/threonine-protein kinase
VAQDVVEARVAAEEGSPADRPDAPATAEEWQTLVSELYARRATAFATASSEALSGVYADGSPQLGADAEHVRALAAAGEVLRGFEPVVVAVTGVTGAGERFELELIDRWPAYDVVLEAAPDGAAVRSGAARGETAVRMTVVRTPAGWRIERAERPA